MPENLTAENGAKAELIGEFHETFTHECSECGGDGLGHASPHCQGETRCEVCNGTGELVERIPVEWTTIKEIYRRAVDLFSSKVRRFRHVKRGTEYRLIGNGKLQQNGPADMVSVVIYQDVNDGSFWVRSTAEFYDGRFKELFPGQSETPSIRNPS